MSILSKEVVAFFTISKTNSVRVAAENLNISPSALSRQIRILEESLGKKLFHRQSRGVVLTEHGKYFLNKITDILKQEADIIESIGSLGGNKTARVSAGIMECMVTDEIGSILIDFSEAKASYFLDVRMGATDDLLGKLLRQDVDFIVCFNTPRDSRIRFIHEYRCPIGLVCSSTHELAKSSSTTLERALDEEIILADSSLSIYSRVEYEIMRRRKSAQITMRTNSISLLKKMVAGGRCVTLLTRLDIIEEAKREELVFIPFQGGRMSETLEIVTHQDLDLTSGAMEVIKAIDDSLRAQGVVVRP